MTGAPAKAELQPPKEGFIPNSQRKSNPFSMDNEPDWVPGSRIRQNGLEPRADRKPLPPPRRGTSNAARESVQSPPVGDKPVAGKSPPAVPRKPLSLSSQAAVSRVASTGSSPSPSASLRDSPGVGSEQGFGGPSSQTGDLLDDASGDPISWKPLLPQR